jgi:hypothetical protein
MHRISLGSHIFSGPLSGRVNGLEKMYHIILPIPYPGQTGRVGEKHARPLIPRIMWHIISITLTLLCFLEEILCKWACKNLRIFVCFLLCHRRDGVMLTLYLSSLTMTSDVG